MKPDEHYPYLNPNVARMADQSDDVRIKYIEKDRFVGHCRAEEILDELEMLYRMEDSVRPQGRLLVGRSLMGKSAIIDQFLKNHRATDNPDGPAAIVPVLSIQYPDTAKEGIYPEILRKLHAAPSSNAKPHQVRSDAISLVQAVGSRIIIIDEIHNLLEGSASAQRKGLNSIKYLMNELRRPIVAAGTAEAVNAVRTDEQISSRLRLLPLKRFKDDQDFMELLAGFEMLLPLRRPSSLDAPALSTLIHQYTLGITGYVSDLLTKAAVVAIESGTEQITEDELKLCAGDELTDIADL
jgi:hypothetical protein